MNLEIDYTKLSEKELRRLITKDDDKALDEFTKRVESGIIQRKRYSIKQLEKMIEKVKKAS
ncbi:MAG: hypothetical protein HYR97_02805 [Candidatus Melainabacteria bacterium]|nr:hypothetical protein [Candidatus Melainabacteria bacterium]